MQPTIGRIVHYVLAEGDAPNPESAGKVRPGIVTRVEGADVDLAVFLAPVDGLVDGSPLVAIEGAISHDDAEPATEVRALRPGQWFWPPRA